MAGGGKTLTVLTDTGGRTQRKTFRKTQRQTNNQTYTKNTKYIVSWLLPYFWTLDTVSASLYLFMLKFGFRS